MHAQQNFYLYIIVSIIENYDIENIILVKYAVFFTSGASYPQTIGICMQMAISRKSKDLSLL